MKKFLTILFSFIFILLFSFIFIFTFCFKTPTNIKNTDIATNNFKPRNVPSIIEGEATYTLEDNGVTLNAKGSLKFKNVEYVFGFFGFNEDKPISDENAPRYKFNEEIKDSYSFYLVDNPVIKAEKLKPYYLLKKYYYFLGYKKDNGVISKLDIQEKDIQPFYTDFDSNTLIPNVAFDGYNFLDYYTNDSFTESIQTFGELEKANSDSLTYPYVYSLYNTSYNDLYRDSFSYFDLSTFFGISGNLDKYVLTRDKGNYYRYTTNSNELRYTSNEMLASYNISTNTLVVYLKDRIKNSPNNYIVPRDVNFVDLSVTNNRLLFADNFSFRALFEFSKAKEIDLTNNSPVFLRDISHMFSNASNLTKVSGFLDLDTKEVRDMSFLFYNTNNLSDIDIKNLDTSKTTNMSYMFYSSNLVDGDLSFLDTSNAVDLKYMFSNINYKLKSINLNLKSAVDIRGMFKDSLEIDDLYISNINAPNLIYLDDFINNVYVHSLFFTKFNLPVFTDFDSLFYDSTVYELIFKDYSYTEFLPFYDALLTNPYSSLINYLTLDNFDMNVTKEEFQLIKREKMIFNLQESLSKSLSCSAYISVKGLYSSKLNATLGGLFEGCDFNYVRFYESTADFTNFSDYSNFFNNITFNYSIDFDFSNQNMYNAKDFTNFLSSDLEDDSHKTISIKFPKTNKPIVEHSSNMFLNRRFSLLDFEGLDFTNTPVEDIKTFGFLYTKQIYLPRIELSDYHQFLKTRYALGNSFNKLTEVFIANDFFVRPISGSYSIGLMFRYFTNIKIFYINPLSFKSNDPSSIIIMPSFFDHFHHSDYGNFNFNINVSNFDFSEFKGRLILDYLFTYSNLSFFKADNWILNNNYRLVGLLYNAVSYSFSTSFDKQLFDISSWRSIYSDSLIHVNNESPNKEGLRFLKDFNNPHPTRMLLDYNLIRKKTFLDLSNFTFDDAVPFESTDVTAANAPTYNPCEGMLIGTFIFNNKRMSEYNLFRESIEKSADEYDYFSAPKPRNLKSLSLNNMRVDTIAPMKSFFKEYFDSIGQNNLENLSFKNWTFVAKTNALDETFSNLGFMHSDINTWNLYNVSYIKNLFALSTIDTPIHLTYVNNLDYIYGLFSHAIIEAPISFVSDGTSEIMTYNSYMFDGTVSGVPLDLKGMKFNRYCQTNNLFALLSFADEENAIIDISGNGRDQEAFHFTANDSYIFPKERYNSIVKVIYDYADVSSFKSIKKELYTISQDTESTPLSELSLRYLKMIDQGDKLHNSNSLLFATYEYINPNFKVNADYIQLENNGSLFQICAYAFHTMSLTNFSTWSGDATNLELAFCEVLESKNNIIDLSNLNVYYSTLNLDNVFFAEDITESSGYPSTITEINTSNWHIMENSYVHLRGSEYTFYYSTFTVWHFDNMIFPSVDKTLFKDIWTGSTYGKLYFNPSLHDNMYPTNFPRPWS